MEGRDAEYGIAVDIGTTTVAMALIKWEKNSGADTGQVGGMEGMTEVHDAGAAGNVRALASVVFTNPQREAALGSDVISRAKNAASDARVAGRMQKLIRDGIAAGVREFFRQAEIGREIISSVQFVIAGNATMLHIFSGLPTEGMIAAPFVPADISLRHEVIAYTGNDVVEQAENQNVYPVRSQSASKSIATIFPCVSAFVGGDIVAGIYALDLLRKKEPTLFVDLGTNGEMVLAVGGKLFATSVAAGPAFEGGNISIGMAAVEGAISHVIIKRGFCRVETIQSAERSAPDGLWDSPRGICGSGLFDAVAGMYRDGIIDRHGTLTEQYIADGFPVYARDAAHRLVLTQDDIRAFQTAKAAVCAGAEALLRAAGIEAEDAGEVWIAGSFGEYLDLRSAATVGLLPGGLMEKAKAVGNTSLAGAKKLLLHPEDEQQVTDIAKHCESINLADDDCFKVTYIAKMEIPPF